MTPREHAEAVVLKGNSCPDCAAGVCRFCVSATNDIEAAIRAAAQPLVDALTALLANEVTAEGCPYLEKYGEDDCVGMQVFGGEKCHVCKARDALSAWEGE